MSFPSFTSNLKLKTHSQLTQNPFTGTDCLPMVGSLQYTTLTNCMHWFHLPTTTGNGADELFCNILLWQHFFLFLGLTNISVGSLHSKPLHGWQIISFLAIPGNKCSHGNTFLTPTHNGWDYSHPLHCPGGGSGPKACGCSTDFHQILKGVFFQVD